MRLIRSRPPIIEQEVKENPYDLIIKQKNFQRDMYIDFLKKFISECCDYDYQHIISIDEVKKHYSKYLHKNHDFIKQYNVSFAITPSDICKLDPRFEYKILTTCKHCLKKQYVGCCPEYIRNDRTKGTFICNLKLINI